MILCLNLCSLCFTLEASWVSGLGIVDEHAISTANAQTSTSRGKYKIYSDEDRYHIGKYTSENGPAAAVRRFKSKFQGINESTCRSIKKKYEKTLDANKRNKQLQKTKLPSVRRGRPLLLGKLDQMVQTYIMAASNRGMVITRSMAVSTARALMKRYPDAIANIDIENSHWAQSLFRRMGFKCRKATTSKPHIPEGARKEIELMFLHSIVRNVEEYSIPHSLILNFDQTPSKFVPASTTTLAKQNSKQVCIAGGSDKRSMTATFTITLDGNFLGMQLIYGGKTEQSLPRYKFPDEFSLSVNPKHYSNETESLKFINEIIIPYVERERERIGLPYQKALVVFDVFKGQLTKSVLKLLEDNNFVVTFVPANMTHLYQPLDLTVNGYAKKYSKKKFNEWYANQIIQQLDEGKQLYEIEVKLRLTTLKPLHAQWLTDLFNLMTSAEGKKIILKGWESAGITEAIEKGLNNLPDLDPFHDIDPMISFNMVKPNLEAVINKTADDFDMLGVRANDNEDTDNDDDDEVYEIDRNVFDIFNDDFVDEADDI